MGSPEIQAAFEFSEDREYEAHAVGMLCCRKCRAWKPEDGFYAHPENRNGRAYICKACAREYTRRWQLENRSRQLLLGARWRAEQGGIPFDLDTGWVQAKIDQGKCELTWDPLDLTPGSDNAPSLDQIRAGSGYTKDNVRVVTFRVNTQINKWGKTGLLETADKIRSVDFVEEFLSVHERLRQDVLDLAEASA